MGRRLQDLFVPDVRSVDGNNGKFLGMPEVHGQLALCEWYGNFHAFCVLPWLTPMTVDIGGFGISAQHSVLKLLDYFLYGAFGINDNLYACRLQYFKGFWTAVAREYNIHPVVHYGLA